ncbi:MAG: alpha/beta hydrolase [Elusimicrobiota bacterium]|nr:alpha/beta hydrolase [Elusimicrobiota bacterium]
MSPRLKRGLAAAVLLSPLALAAAVALNVRLRETLDRRQAAPPEGRFVPAGDVELFVSEWGPPGAPVVLFTHGMGAWSGLWGLALGSACREVRCVAVDQSPFGYSQRPADSSYDRGASARRLWALADSLGAEKVSIVGHSFGGGAAAEAALLHPERVRRLVLIAPALGLGAPPAAPGVAGALLKRPAVARLVVAATLANPLLQRRGLARFMADPSRATPAMAAVLRRPLYSKGFVAGLADWLPRFLFDAETGLSADPKSYARLTMPTLLVWGDRDTTTPLPQGEALKALIPGSRLEILPGIGHMPQLESPAAVQALLAAHLAP